MSPITNLSWAARVEFGGGLLPFALDEPIHSQPVPTELPSLGKRTADVATTVLSLAVKKPCTRQIFGLRQARRNEKIEKLYTFIKKRERASPHSIKKFTFKHLAKSPQMADEYRRELVREDRIARERGRYICKSVSIEQEQQQQKKPDITKKLLHRDEIILSFIQNHRNPTTREIETHLKNEGMIYSSRTIFKILKKLDDKIASSFIGHNKCWFIKKSAQNKLKETPPLIEPKAIETSLAQNATDLPLRMKAIIATYEYIYARRETGANLEEIGKICARGIDKTALFYLKYLTDEKLIRKSERERYSCTFPAIPPSEVIERWRRESSSSKV